MILYLARRIVVLLIVTGLSCAGLRSQASRVSNAEERGARPVRHLIICVDGVGFSTIEKMRAEGRFRLFQTPSRMIAPFPTVTNVAMTEILADAGAGAAAGYEDNYYDVEKNRMRGGMIDRFREDRFIKGSFRELFDYHPSALKSGLGYAAPPLSIYLEALSDLVRLRQKFDGSREPVYFVYTGAADSLAHSGGESLVRSFLTRLDNTVTDIISDSKGRTTVTIFSDHGNHFRKYRRVSLKSALRRAGMRLEGRVRDERSVVLPQFGLVGSAAIFTKERNEARLSEVAAKVQGVDFAAYENNGIAHVVSREGAGVIERRENTFRYRAERGDPLGLLVAARDLAAQGRADADGFIADEDWFAATRDSARPDVVRRVHEGVTNHVRNRANVILNFEDGYYTGSALLDLFTILRSTHGNLGREQSFGFVMSTAYALPAYLRARDVWGAIGNPKLRNGSVPQALAGRH